MTQDRTPTFDDRLKALNDVRNLIKDDIKSAEQKGARDLLIYLAAECKFECHPDGDVDDYGRPIDCTTYTITGINQQHLQELLDMADINHTYQDPWSAFQRAVDKECPSTPTPTPTPTPQTDVAD